MVKWLLNVLAVVALASAQYAATQQNAPVLPKASSSWAPQQQSYGQPMIEQPAQQPALPQPQTYAPQPQPIQQQQPQVPAPQPETYAPQPAPQQQPPAPQPQAYAPAPQQQPAVPQPQTYAPQPQPAQQQPAPQPQTYAPAPQQQQPALPQPQGYAPQQQQPAPQPQAYAPAPQQQAPQQTYGRPQQTPPKPRPNFDCTARADGMYAMGKCQSQYILCLYGEPQLTTCPAGLTFDGEKCEYKNLCMNPTPPPPPPPPQQQQPASGYGRQFNPYGQKPVQQQPPAPVETFCQENNFSEGYHTKGCSQTYYACSPVNTIKLVCAGGTFYDEEAQECGYKNHVPACGGSRPTPPPAQTQPLAPYGQQQAPALAPRVSYAPAPQPIYGQPMPQQQQPQQPMQTSYGYSQPAPQQQQPKAPIETFCQENNFSEGYHTKGCSQTYYACSPAHTMKLTCAGGTFYDEEAQECGYKHHVPACGGSRPTPPPAQTQPLAPYGSAPQQQQPMQTYGQPQTYAPAPQQQQPQAPQPQTYAPQPAQQQPAPQPQTYAPAPQQQQPALPQPQGYAPQPAPQQQPPAPQPQGYAPAPQQTYGQRQQAPPKPAETFCSERNLADGFHGRGCSSHFYVCAAGQTTRMECPLGLFYDQETNECGQKSVIVACGGTKPTQPPAQQPPMSGPYGQAPIARQPPPPPEFDCTGRKDGIYIRGCTSKYFVCIQGSVMSLSCPQGTFYSAFTEKCDYQAHVVECGGKAPEKTEPAQNPVMIPKSSYGPAPVQQQQPAPKYGQPQSPAQQAPAKPTRPCETLSNGIYGRKCSRFFFVCASQKTYDFICPKDHAFNLKTVKCAPKTEITTCPEFGVIEQPIQQTPAQPIEIKLPQANNYAAPAPVQQQQPQAPRTNYAAPAPVQQQQPQAPRTDYAAPAPQPIQQQPQAPRNNYVAPAPQPIQQQQPVAPRTDYAAPAPQPIQQQQPQAPRADYAAPAPAPVQQQQPQAPRTNYAAPAPVQQQQPQAPRADYAAPAPQPIQQQQPQAPRTDYAAPAPLQQQQPQGGY